MASQSGLGGKGAVRRLVAGIDDQGCTRILADGPAPRRLIHRSSGLDMVDLWATDMVPPRCDRDDADPSLTPHRYFPGPGGTRFLINRIPSAAQRRALAAAASPQDDINFFAQVPGMAETFERDGGGMHRSPTIDYGLILDGAIDLELDDGVVTRLYAGDSYVLEAARHHWHPLEDSGCTIAVVLVGADSDSVAARLA
ncbi:MAG: hypothetical protein ABW048_04535 [Sphingobium sp.]